MQLPLEITFRDIDNTQAIDAVIRKKVKKLHHICEDITFCNVVVEAIQKRKHKGKEFQVNVEVKIPGEPLLVVTNQSHRNEDLYVAIRDSFKAMKSQLISHTEKQRGDTKTHQAQLTGKIVRLFPDYGFIESSEGNEYYFHETNVATASFENLAVGLTVRFIENSAGDGLQANQVNIV